ncbi:DUF3560 domain-containing protein [Thermoactinomyces sp. DSM 45892]|uniref:DUF3560 domain-containing protein n=1 Tax=Thermoactinomyces sp. DSM 45892 TaxID=1882753 RepID=UPI00089D58DF|nr:DUF3560 domain-containing protein [Thermoactinomyces sp. DSM 45892]SDY88980.1 protein of unknown function [Thermoactinomyces sp. DSM 45892]
MNYEEKKEQRIERYERLAEKHQELSNAYCNSHSIQTLRGMAGEPIKVGHHSEGRHRRLVERGHNDMRKSIDHSKTSEYYIRKAEAARNNKAIYSDDEDAIEKLSMRIEELVEIHETMKTANAEYRKYKGDVDRMSVSERIKETIRRNREGVHNPEKYKPFASYCLTNSNANIKRLKRRLEALQKASQDVTTEITINGITIVDNVEDKRLQMFFNGKPPKEIRTKLKRHGFRWAMSKGAWQRYRCSYVMEWAKEMAESISSMK